MNEVYFGGDGCATCGHAIREPWNRPHAEWCSEVSARLKRESLGGMNPTGASGKFTATEIRHIRSRVGTGEAQAAVARDFGVTPSTIHDIVVRKWWKHVA